MKELNLICRDVRFREVGIRRVHKKMAPKDIELIRRDYFANENWETFLSYEDPHQDSLIGLLRLRRLGNKKFMKELEGKVSMIRELHVYGSVVPIHARDPK